MAKDDGTVMIEDAQIIFRNFEGREGPYNRLGDRSFCVKLDRAFAEQLATDGWLIKALKAREEGDEEQPYIQVAVEFGKDRPPKVVLITSRGRTELSEREVEIIDSVDIANVDLIFRPYTWNVNGKTGVKAYLKSMFITVEEDELDAKYVNVPDAHDTV